MKKLKLLSLMLVILTVFFAFGITSSAATSNTFRTSPSSYEYVEMTISGSTMNVSGIIHYDNLSIVAVVCGKATIGYGTAESGKKFSFDCDLSSITSDQTIWIGAGIEKSGGGYHVDSYSNDTIVISKSSSGYSFLQSTELAANNSFKISSLNPSLYRGIEYSSAVKAQADSIVKGCTTDYDKLFAIHKWIADNLYYNYDFLYGKTDDVYYMADDVLQHKITICQGYAELMVAMCSSQNIPCFIVESYALGVSASASDPDSFALKACTAKEANHATVAAYADGRWINCDPTWDSRNEYKDGTATKNDGGRYYYFDISDEAFALDHKITAIGETTSQECSHSWDGGKVTKNATCTENGVITYTCSLCGITKSETISKTNHTYSDKYTNNDSSHWKECSTCGVHTDEGEHSWNKEVTREATVDQNGVITYTCTVCGFQKTELTDKLPKTEDTTVAETEAEVTEKVTEKETEAETEAEIGDETTADTENSETEQEIEPISDTETEGDTETEAVTEAETETAEEKVEETDGDVTEADNTTDVSDTSAETDDGDASSDDENSSFPIAVVSIAIGCAVVAMIGIAIVVLKKK